MAEVLLDFSQPVIHADGIVYHARACGRQADDGRWEGWIEFESAAGEVLRTGRETTQPNFTDLVYWATGLSPVYLDGALERTRQPVVAEVIETPTPAFDGPADSVDARSMPITGPAVLDPFAAYAKGPELLRTQLSALRAWQLARIVRAYDLSDDPADDIDGLSHAELAALIERRAAVRFR